MQGIKDVVVIGSTGLCLECCKLLQPYFNILAIVSSDSLLQQWSKEQSITCIPYTAFKEADYKNYLLFSIINYHIISPSLLKKHAVKLAINYHDSLLPRYAGVNSTTWAILNNEKKHGVTWHKIVSGVDEGDILKQAELDIDEEETARSLNLKCTEKATGLFRELLNDISADDLKPVKQNLSQRTYFGCSYLPDHYGFINGCDNLAAIDRLCRALYFGEYDNPVATAKVKLNDAVYTLALPKFIKNANRDKQGLYITDNKSALHFPLVMNSYGQEVSLNKIIPLKELNTKYHHFSLSRQTTEKLAHLRKNERKQLACLSTLGEMNKSGLLSSVYQSFKKVTFFTKELSLNNDELLSVLSMILLRFAQNDFFITVYSPKENKDLDALTDTKYFIPLYHQFCDKSWLKFQNHVNRESQYLFNVSKDCFYRYHLMDNITDIGIYINSDPNSIQPHQLVFDVQQDRLMIIGYREDQLILDAICSTVNAVVDFYSSLTKKTLLKDIPLLSKSDYQKIVIDWNKTDKKYPEDKTIHQLFEEQAARTPDNIAVVFEEQSLTYRQLNEKSNQLARYIRKEYLRETGNELKADTLIALCIDKSLEMIISIIGILKSGACYVPIDPGCPDKRISYILEDTSASYLLTKSCYADRLRSIKNSILVVDSNGSYQKFPDNNLITKSFSHDLAYVIYTSGTTGKPKGVMVEHESLVNTICFLACLYQLKDTDRLTQFCSFSFDVAYAEIFTSLSTGAALHIFTEEIRKEPNKIIQYLNEKEITHAYFPPVLLAQFPQQDILQLKTLSYAGEPCCRKVAEYWSIQVKLLNLYGPTETTIYTLYRKIHKDEINNIGRPINNSKAYVLNKNGNNVPVGVVGELHISGIGLARGYLNQPELTAEKFIINPFATEEDIARDYTRLYKTGDLVRWLPDGNLEYIGRNDFQVKIRGHRIELGEIEKSLMAIDNIQQAVVISKEHHHEKNNKFLVGYVKTKEDMKIDSELISGQLSKNLPKYMIPSIFIQVDFFPLTVSGKLDRNSLPSAKCISDSHYIPAKTDIEKTLCAFFQEVFSLEKIGINDNFFKLGGNSIIAIKLSHKISDELSTDCSVSSIFENPTIEKLSFYLKSQKKNNIRIPKYFFKEYPLSLAQERLWFIEQYEKGSSVYHIPILLKLNSVTDQDKLKNVFHRIIHRHEILRTIFKKDSTAYHQVIINKKLNINDYTDVKEKLDKQIFKDINTPFNLENDLPIRVSFYHHQDNTRLLINIHHIAVDGWSLDILFNEMNLLYFDKDLPDLDIQYADFSYWQKSYLQNAQLCEDLSYWCQRLTGYQQLRLPVDKKRPHKIKYTGDNYSFKIDKSLSDKLRNLAQLQNCSLYTVLLSGFYILLSKYSGQDDIVIGTPVANRSHHQLRNLIGLFVNTVVLREKIEQNNNVLSLIKNVSNRLIETKKYEDLPFEKLIDELKVDHDSSRHPIFQVMFAMDSFLAKINNHLFTVLPIDNYYRIAKFDLTCIVNDSDNEIKGNFNFSTSLYHRATIHRLTIHYLNILQCMVNDSNQAIKNYQLLTKSEYQKIIVKWNQTEKDYPEKTIDQLFEDQVEKTPNNIAVVFEKQSLTYRELNEKSNQLARYLRFNFAIRTDSLVALFLEKSLEMTIGILGILKSGGAYVPIDPNYPASRLYYIIKDTGTKIVLTQSHLKDKLNQLSGLNFLSLDRPNYQNEKVTNLAIKRNAHDLAYVIYTSGTTGHPKGVMIEHKSIANTIYFLKKIYKLSIQDNVTQFTSLVFDVSVSEIFITITQGATLHVFSTEVKKDLRKIESYLVDQHITYSYFPPVILSQLKSKGNFQSGAVIYAGEPCNMNVAKYWSKETKLFNLYGPTETTVYALYKRIICNEVEQIGKPIENIKVYVLDENLNPLPIGVIGELYICGLGLARGYLNQSKLTTKKFISNPFAMKRCKERNDIKLYKTGDLVRWLPNGNLEYMGRDDSQIKIRGYRIELGEIENTLIKISGITSAIVTVKEKSQDKYLLAYYVANTQITHKNIFNQLKQHLPQYMIPSHLLQIDKIPLTINGKVDVKALPDIEFNSDKSYTAPVTEKERLICHAFETVLEQPRVGINDDFFILGGNSIKAIQLSLILQANFDISVSEIFDMRTPGEMSKNKNITHNVILGKLQQLKANYYKHDFNVVSEYDRKNLEAYWSKINSIKLNFFTLKPIKNVLLTGGRGYLGCNLLNQLLKLTSYNIFILIRAYTIEEAKNSLVRKFQFYFKRDLQKYISRIHIIPCDLEKSNLGLCNDFYQDLIKNVDSIIHCAALTKHYGSEDAFYSANVEATKNLLNFCSLTDLKDFHYISTFSVFEGINNEKGQHVFTEYDNPSDLESCSIIYNKTKYLGEIETINFRQKGVQSSIYRVGNLAFMQENCQLQENIEDNAFFNNLRFLIRLGYVPQEMDEIQISPTDLTAEAIIKIFDKKELSNKIYHVFNPNKINLSDFLESKSGKVKKLGFAKFIDKLINYLHHNSDCELVSRYLLRMGWQDGEENKTIFFDRIGVKVFQNKTERILNQLNFKWDDIQYNSLTTYYSKLFSY